MRTFNLFASGFLLFFSFFVHSINAQNCTLPAPADMTVSFPNQSSARLDWTPVAGAWGYKIQVLNQNSNGVSTYTVQSPTTHLIISTDPANSYYVAARAKCTSEYDSDQYLPRSFVAPSYIIVADVIPYNGTNMNCGSPFPVYSQQGNLVQNTEYSSLNITNIQVRQTYLFSFNYNGNEWVQGTILRDRMEHVNFTVETGGWSAQNVTTSKIVISKAKNEANTLIEISLNPIIFSTQMGGPLYLMALNSNISNFSLYLCSEGGNEPGLETSNATTSNSLPSFQVSPNPFTDELNIQMDESNTQAFQARLFNTSGQLCLSVDVSKEDANTRIRSLPTDALAPGMYCLHLSTGNGDTVVKKVIKM